MCTQASSSLGRVNEKKKEKDSSSLGSVNEKKEEKEKEK